MRTRTWRARNEKRGAGASVAASQQRQKKVVQKRTWGVTGSEKSGTSGVVGRTEDTREDARVSARFPVHLLRECVDHRCRDQELLVVFGVVLLRRASRVPPERWDVRDLEDAGGQDLGFVERSAPGRVDAVCNAPPRLSSGREVLMPRVFKPTFVDAGVVARAAHAAITPSVPVPSAKRRQPPPLEDARMPSSPDASSGVLSARLVAEAAMMCGPTRASRARVCAPSVRPR